MQTRTWYLTLLGARRFPRCPGNLVREPARNRKPGEKDGSGRSQTSAPRHRPSGRPGRARAGGSSRGAANSPPAPPPGALPSKPLLPAPLQTAGPRRPGVTEAAAGRLRRPVAGARGWGVGSAGFQSAFPPPSELGTPPPPPPPLRGARPERILRGCVTAGGAGSSRCSPESQQASAGGGGRGRARLAGPGVGFGRRGGGRCAPPRRWAAESGLASAGALVRAQGGNAGGGGGGGAREVPRARPLAAGVEGIGRLGRWHRPSCGHGLVGGGGSRAGPVAPGSVHGRGRARVRPRVARGALRRDAGECIGGKVGAGAFLEKGQDSGGGLAPPPCGRWRAPATPAGWYQLVCPVVRRPSARPPALSGRLETCRGRAVCGGLGPGAPGAERGGSSGRSPPWRRVR